MKLLIWPTRFAFNCSVFFTIVLIILIFEQVLARYFWSASSVFFQELTWYLFSFAIMLAIGQTLQDDRHVRVDLFYARFSPKTKKKIDGIATILLIWPTCWLGIYFGSLYVLDAFAFLENQNNFLLNGEASPDPGGLPARWIPRSAIPLGFILLFWQSLIALFYSKGK